MWYVNYIFVHLGVNDPYVLYKLCDMWINPVSWQWIIFSLQVLYKLCDMWIEEVYLQKKRLKKVLYKLCDMWIFYIYSHYWFYFVFYINYVICELLWSYSLTGLSSPFYINYVICELVLCFPFLSFYYLVLYKLCDMWMMLFEML